MLAGSCRVDWDSAITSNRIRESASDPKRKRDDDTLPPKPTTVIAKDQFSADLPCHVDRDDGFYF